MKRQPRVPDRSLRPRKDIYANDHTPEGLAAAADAEYAAGTPLNKFEQPADGIAFAEEPCRLVIVTRCPHCGFVDPQQLMPMPTPRLTGCDNCAKDFEIRDLDITDAQHELLVALGEA